MKLIVARSGYGSSVQDPGRAGYREIGVSPGGALDPFSLRVINLSVGNDETAAGLEFTSGKMTLRFQDSRLVAWAGGEYEVRIRDVLVPAGHAAIIGTGEELTIAGPAHGCRGWLAVSGGLTTPVMLGSRATDLRTGFGGQEGRFLRDGDELPLGELPARAQRQIGRMAGQVVASWSARRDWVSPVVQFPTLRVIQGAEWESFTEESRHSLLREPFEVLPGSDRMGARLQGFTLLRRHSETDLLSEAVAPGTIQVPPSGHPIVLLGDCQTVGGYPKIAHVITVDLPAAAQLRALDTVRFREVSLLEAQQLLAQRARDYCQFKVAVSLRMS